MTSGKQRVIERNSARFAILQRRDMRLSEAAVAEKLTRQGVAINGVDQTPFRANLGPYYTATAGDLGATAWGLLQSSLDRKLN